MGDGGADEVNPGTDNQHPHVDQLDADPHEGDEQDQLEHGLERFQEVLLQLGGQAVGAGHQPGVDLAHERDAAWHLQHVQCRRQGLKDNDAAEQDQDDTDGDAEEKAELSHGGLQRLLHDIEDSRQ